MEPEEPKTLYISAEAVPQYYYLPADVVLAEGRLILRDIHGTEIRVDIEAVTAYEIPREEAEALIRAEVERGLEQFADLMKLETETYAQENAEQIAASQEQAEQVVKALFGFTAEELNENPELAEQNTDKIEDFFEGLKTVLGGALSGDEESLQAANERMRQFAATLEGVGVDMSDTLEQLPDQLHDTFYSAEHKRNLEETAAQLEAFRERIPELAQQLDQFLHEQAQSLRAQAAEIHVVEKPAPVSIPADLKSPPKTSRKTYSNKG